MTMLWLLPPAILIVGCVGLLLIARRTNESLADLGRALLGLQDLEPATVKVRTAAAERRAAMEQLEQR